MANTIQPFINIVNEITISCDKQTNYIIASKAYREIMRRYEYIDVNAIKSTSPEDIFNELNLEPKFKRIEGIVKDYLIKFIIDTDNIEFNEKLLQVIYKISLEYYPNVNIIHEYHSEDHKKCGKIIIDSCGTSYFRYKDMCFLN